MSPQPITGYLADFDAPPAAPATPAPRAAPPGAAQARPAAHPPAANDVAADDERLARAFAEGKQEGLKLAEARHALERRRREGEEDRRAAERVAEAERRIGALFAERLAEETANLEARLSREVAACLVPFVTDAAEARAVEALAADAMRLPAAASWTVHGPRRLVDALLTRLDPPLRERVAVRPGEEVELSVTTDEVRLTTRLGELRDALRAA